MKNTFRVASALAAASMLLAMPAHAESAGNAEKLRRLDIMLMVTGLRCRTGNDNFQADFHEFEANHLADLNAATRRLRADLVGRFGERGADRELDRLSTITANAYGEGHPWLGCHQLKQVTHSLAETDGSEALLAAADELLIGDGPRLSYSGG